MTTDRKIIDGIEYLYDDNDNLIYSKNSNGLESCYEYDANNNLIHYKDSAGYESWL